MITKEYGCFHLFCDHCNEPVRQDFATVWDAVGYAEKNGWRRKRSTEDWENICPDCKEGGR